MRGRAGSVPEISVFPTESPVDGSRDLGFSNPEISVKHKNFNFRAYLSIGNSAVSLQLNGMPYEHFIPVTGMNGGMNSGGPDGIVLHCLLYFPHHKHPI